MNLHEIFFNSCSYAQFFLCLFILVHLYIFQPFWRLEILCWNNLVVAWGLDGTVCFKLMLVIHFLSKFTISKIAKSSANLFSNHLGNESPSVLLINKFIDSTWQFMISNKKKNWCIRLYVETSWGWAGPSSMLEVIVVSQR